MVNSIFIFGFYFIYELSKYYMNLKQVYVDVLIAKFPSLKPTLN